MQVSAIVETVEKYTFLKYISSNATILGIFVICLHIAMGVCFFMFVHGEEMSFVNALYFCFVTLTTVGYGDLEPKTDIGKLFVRYGISLHTTHHKSNNQHTHTHTVFTSCSV